MNLIWGNFSLTSWSMAQVAVRFLSSTGEIGSGYVRPIVYLLIGLLVPTYVISALLVVERALTDGLGYFD